MKTKIKICGLKRIEDVISVNVAERITVDLFSMFREAEEASGLSSLTYWWTC